MIDIFHIFKSLLEVIFYYAFIVNEYLEEKLLMVFLIQITDKFLN